MPRAEPVLEQLPLQPFSPLFEARPIHLTLLQVYHLVLCLRVHLILCPLDPLLALLQALKMSHLALPFGQQLQLEEPLGLLMLLECLLIEVFTNQRE